MTCCRNDRMENDFLKKISEDISRHDLLRRDGFYIVALSGGADSVALLRSLAALGYRVHAAHCNFHLRGEESNRDEQFCVRLCETLGVELHRIHFDTTDYARLHKVSIEMAARTLRYRYFGQLCHDIQADGICVAHHSDDQAETILLNIVRGTGLRGLQGMRWRNGNILRPMLGVSRCDVVCFLEGIGQDFVTDRTNLEDDVQRNKIRLNVMPVLESINPAVRDNILRMAGHLGEAETIVRQSLDEQARRVCAEPASPVLLDIDLPALMRQPAPESLLWHLLGTYGFSRTQVEEMTVNQSNGNVWTNGERVAVIDRSHLCVIDKAEWESCTVSMRIPECGNYVLRQGSHEMRFTFSEETGCPDPSRQAATATVDADKVAFPLTLRTTQPGDRFVPFGMKGSKLVSDFLTDAKATALEKRRQLVLADRTGTVVWLVGRRVDGRAAIDRNTTKRVLTVKMA